jgi:hypothetical protein
VSQMSKSRGDRHSTSKTQDRSIMKERLRYLGRFSKFYAESNSRALTRTMSMQRYLMLKFQEKERKMLEAPSEIASPICVLKFSLMPSHF